MNRITAFLIIATSIFALFGCTKEEHSPKKSEPGHLTPEYNENEATQSGLMVTLASLSIRNPDSGNFKDELVKQISSSKTANWADEEYSKHFINNIPRINDFYYPTLKIDGYELFCVEVTPYAFNYYFAPSEEFKKEEWYHFMYDTGILIQIRRLYHPDFIGSLDPIIEQFDEQGKSYIYQDGLIYRECNNNIYMQIGNTRLSISVPDTLNNFEYLRDLAFQLIETAELVIIED